jgi:hypothetical protein
MVKCNRCENDAMGVVAGSDEPLCPDCMLVLLEDCSVHKRQVNISYYVSSDAAEALLAFAKERQRTKKRFDIRVSKPVLPTTSAMYGRLQCRCGYVSEHPGYKDMSDHVTFKHCHSVSPDGLLNDLQDVWSGKLKKWKAERVEAEKQIAESVAPIRERISPIKRKEGRFMRFLAWVRKKAHPVPKR